MSVNTLAEQLRQGDPERFLSVMALPAPKRAPLFVLYAFNLEVARAAGKTSEPMIGLMRLQWWIDALTELTDGKAPRKHEIVQPLAEYLSAEQAQKLITLVEARRADLEPVPFADSTGLWAYLDATNGTLTENSAELLGVTNAAALRAPGAAIGLANWLRAVPAMQRAGRQPLPDSSDEALQALAREGLVKLTRTWHDDRGARKALLLLSNAHHVLTRVVNKPQSVLSGGLDPSPFAFRLRLLLGSHGLVG